MLLFFFFKYQTVKLKYRPGLDALHRGLTALTHGCKREPTQEAEHRARANIQSRGVQTAGTRLGFWGVTPQVIGCPQACRGDSI